MSLSPEEKAALRARITTPEESRVNQVNTNLDVAVKIDPDRAGVVRQLSQETDTPLDVVDRNLDDIKRVSQRNAMIIDPYKHPGTTKYLSKFDNAEVAHDSTADLTKYEEKQRKNDDFTNSLVGAWEATHTALGKALQMFSGLSDDVMSEASRLMPENVSIMGLNKQSGIVQSGLKEVGKFGEQIEDTGESKGYEQRYTLDQMLDNPTIGNTAGLIMEGGITSAPYMVEAMLSPITFLATMGEQIADTRSENNNTETGLKDRAIGLGVAIPIAVAEKFFLGKLFGAPTTAAEKTVIAAAAKKKAARAGDADATKAAGAAFRAEQAAIKANAPITSTKAAVGLAATETARKVGTEMGQESIEELWEYMGGTVGTDKGANLQDAWKAALGGAIVSVGTSTAIGGTVSSVEAYKRRQIGHMVTTGKSIVDQRYIDNTITFMQENKVAGRDRESIREFLNLTGGDKTIYIERDVIKAAISEGIKLPDIITNQFNDTTRTSISMKASEFALDVATNEEVLNRLRDHVKMDPQAYTKSEMMSNDVGADIKKMMGKVVKDKTTRDEAQQFEDKYVEQLMATGRYTERDARLSAILMSSQMATATQKRRDAGETDLTIAGLAAQFGVDIQGPNTPAPAATEGETIVNQESGSTEIDPQAFYDARVQQQATEQNMTPEQLAAIKSGPDTDNLTGLYSGDELISAVQRATTGDSKSTYVETDTYNLGGINKAMGANSKADQVIKEIGDAYAKAFKGVPVFRRGGARFAAIVPEGYDVAAATAMLEKTVAAIADKYNLTDIPGARSDQAGIAVYTGVSPLNKGNTVDEVVSKAQNEIKQQSPQENANVDGSETFETWVSTSSGRAGEAARRNLKAGRGSAGTEQTNNSETGSFARASKPAEGKPLGILTAPDQYTADEFTARADKAGLTADQRKPFTPVTKRDSVTGWFTDKDRAATIKRVQKLIGEGGEQQGMNAGYVSADIGNLGGMNKVLGNKIADEVFNEMANILLDSLRALDNVDVVPFRHGGDEISFVVLGVDSEQLNNILAEASKDVQRYVNSIGMRDLPHAKYIGKTEKYGSGVYTGVSAIDPDMTVNDMFDEADALTEDAKSAGKPDVNGETLPLMSSSMFTQAAIDAAVKEASSLNSKEVLVYMSPQQFLSLAADMAEGPEQDKLQGVRDVTAAGTGKQIPSLGFTHNGQGVAKVTTHEGRHKALIAIERGEKEIPVRLMSEGGDGKEIRFDRQDEEGRNKIEVWPTKLIGQDNRLTVPFPVKQGQSGSIMSDSKRREQIKVNLSSAVSSAEKNMPGLTELYERANNGEKEAISTLQHVTYDSVSYLTSGIDSVVISYDNTVGLFGGTVEPSVAVTISFDAGDREQVLAVIGQFGRNFKQDQVHMLEASESTGDELRTYADGSYDTPVVNINLSRPLTRQELDSVIRYSDLYGMNTTDKRLEFYFVGDVNNDEDIREFEQKTKRAIAAVSKIGGLAGESDSHPARIRTSRLSVFGEGGIEYPKGDIRPAASPATESTAHRIAEGLKGGSVTPVQQSADYNMPLHKAIMRAYEALPINDMANPLVRMAYEALAAETIRQYKALPIKVWKKAWNGATFRDGRKYGKGEPYANSNEMRHDVLHNNTLVILGTDAKAFGPEGIVYDDHPLLRDSGLFDEAGKPLLINDCFRAIHDYYAHTMSPVQFGPKGEEAAWRNHMAMTRDPLARWALTTETRGQNSWVNARDEVQGLPLNKRGFAIQKVGLLPIKYALTGDPEVDAVMQDLVDEYDDPTTLHQSVSLRKRTETLRRFGLDPNKRHNTRDVAAALEARQREKYGMTERNDRSPEALKKISDWMTQEVLFELENPEKSGVGWYGEKYQKAMDIFSKKFPELATDKSARDTFTAIVALTSDGQKVVGNFKMAADIYSNYRTTGKLTTNMGTQRQSSVDINLDNLQNLIDTMGAEAAHAYLMEEMTVGELKKLARESGVEFNSDYKVDVVMPRAALILGPKLGAFYANLMGAHGYLTMDRWWSRTFNRYRGTLLQNVSGTADKPVDSKGRKIGLARFKELIGEPNISDDEALSRLIAPQKAYADRGYKNGTEIETVANTLYKQAFINIEDAPFNASDRSFMLDVVNRTAKSLKRRGHEMSIADIQAILWYYEKRLYGELGARQTADISYEEAANRAIGDQPNGPDTSDELDGDNEVGEEPWEGEGETTFYQEAQRNNIGLYSAIEQAIIEMKLPQWKVAKGEPLTVEEKARYDELRNEGANASNKEFKALQDKLRANIPMARGKDIWAKLMTTPGIQKMEYEFLGLEEYLNTNVMMDRQQVIEYIRNNGPVFEVVSDASNGMPDPDDIDWNEREYDYYDSGREDYDIDDAKDIVAEFEDDPEGYDFGQHNWSPARDWFPSNKEKIVEHYGLRGNEAQLEMFDETEREMLDSMEPDALLIVINNRHPEWLEDFAEDVGEGFKEYLMEEARDQYYNDPDMVLEYEGYIIRYSGGEYNVVTPRGRDVGTAYSLNEAQVMAMEAMRDNGDLGSGGGGTQFSQYVSDGEYDEYRETRVTLPETNGSFDYRAHFPESNIMYFTRTTQRGNEHRIEELQSDWLSSQRKIRNEVIERVTRMVVQDYVADHYAPFDEYDENGKVLPVSQLDINNELLEDLRTYDKKTPKSDLFWELKKKAVAMVPKELGWDTYNNDDIHGAKVEVLVLKEAAVIDKLFSDAGIHRDQVGDRPSGDIVQQRTDILNNSRELLELRREIGVQEALAKAKQLPKPPYTDDAYLSLALKRELIVAVENGSKYFTWVVGDIVQERWSDNFDYTPQYDQKMVSIIKKLTGIAPERDGDVWKIELTPELKQRIEGEAFTMFQKQWYRSALKDAAESLTQSKGTPEQMLAMLKKGGAKQDEMDAIGLPEFMELAGKSVTKEALVEFISNNGVQLDTTVLGEDDSDFELPAGYNWTTSQDGDLWVIKDSDGDEVSRGKTKREAMNYGGGNTEIREANFRRNLPARNTTYTLPGGTNHKEFVLSIPTIEPWNTSDTTHYGDVAGGKSIMWVRTADFIDADGKLVLVIEEEQTKRGQEGREKGFIKKYDRNEVIPMTEGFEVTDPDRFWYFRVPGNVLQIPKSKYKNESDAIDYIVSEKKESGFVPSAPFIQKTDAWVALGIKRMIAYGAENGYDRIAFTTGKQQADRYKLSTQVKSIEVSNITDNHRDVTIFMPDNDNFIEVTVNSQGEVTDTARSNGNQFLGKKLDEVIGKDIAKDIMESESDKAYEGDNLDIGGEGMKTFYDKIIPKVAKEVIKKMGGEGLIDVKLESPVKKTYDLQAVQPSDSDGWLIMEFNRVKWMSKSGDLVDDINQAEVFKSKDDANDTAEKIKLAIPYLSQPGFDITPAMREAVDKGLPLFQRPPADQPRGSITMPTATNPNYLIRLTQASDRSTFLHEASHLFLEMERDFARKYGVDKDQQALLDWLGIANFDQVTRQEHEKFAETFEVYLMEGKAPSVRLRNSFRAFKNWLLSVYKLFGTKDDRLSRADLQPEIKDFFDKMLATKEEIAMATMDPQFEAMFDEKHPGMSDDEWKKYQEQKQKRSDKAEETVFQKVVKELKKRKSKEWSDERKVLIDAEMEQLELLPVYKLMKDLAVAPMDNKALKEVAGYDKIPGKLIGKVKNDGVDPQEYAEVYGYRSVQEMYDDIIKTDPIKKAAHDNAEAQMIDKYGDILNDGSIEQEAKEALHNEEQAELLLKEMRALNKRGAEQFNRELLKQNAKDSIAKLKYDQIQPNQFYQAEIRAAKKAATAKTDDEKFKYKVQQLINHYLYKEAIETKDRMDSNRKYIRGVQTREYSARQVDPVYVANMKAIANLYDMRTNPQRVQTVQSVLEWYKGQLGPDTLVDVTLLDHNLIAALEAQADGRLPQLTIPTFDDLTAEELQAVADQLKHLRHLGGLLSEESRAETRLKAESLAASIITNGGKDRASTPGVKQRGDDIKQTFNDLVNRMPSLRNLMRKLDNAFKDRPDGKGFEYIYQPIEEAVNRKLAISRKIYDDFKDDFNEVHKLAISRKIDKVYTLESGATMQLNSEGRVMMAMYWGTQSSREAIMQGFGMSERDVMTILSDLTVPQLETVNKLWRMNETLWPELSAASIARHGVAPPKLDATPFVVNGVSMTGGHMRLFYDAVDIDKKIEQTDAEMMQSIMPTKAGSLHARVGSGGRPVLLDINSIAKAMNENIHYIAFAEMSSEVSTILHNKDVKAAIERKHGRGFWNALTDNVKNITANRNEREAVRGLAKIAKLARSAATMKHLAWSIRNTVQQFSGVKIVTDEVGVIPFVSALTRIFMTGDSGATREFIHSRSQFMTNRTSLVNREAAEHLQKINVSGKAEYMWKTFGELGFAPQTVVDSLFAYPVWLATYERQLAKHGDDKLAASEADTAVSESVGSGSDLHAGALYQANNTEFIKLMTAFGSWFNAYYNRVYRETGGFSPADLDYKAVRALLVTPAITAVISSMLVMDMPDDDEEWYEWAAKSYAGFMFAMIPLLRDVAGAFKGYTPKTAVSGLLESPAALYNEIKAYNKGNQSLGKTAVDVTKYTVTSVVPIPGSGQVLRILDFMDSNSQGEESGSPIKKTYQAMVKGPEK